MNKLDLKKIIEQNNNDFPIDKMIGKNKDENMENEDVKNDENRKLATIAKIEEINPIDGADAIEVATIRAWSVVVKKDEFIENDLCVYCEIDSVLPSYVESFDFLKNKKYRIKTIKLRGQVSQGIAFPLSILEETTNGNIVEKNGEYFLRIQQKKRVNDIPLKENLDVTRLMDIRKFEPNIPPQLAGKMKGNYPSHSIKTDEERIENLGGKKYEELKKHKFYETEKLDGSSETIYLKDDIFGVTSRNIDLIETSDNTFWKVARELDIEKKMRKWAKENNITNFNLQGELLGEGIQGNKYKLKGHTIRFFRSFNIDEFQFFDYLFFLDMIKDMGLETVPILGVVELPETVNELKLHVQGKSILNPKIEREGSVFVSVDFVERHHGRLSFKGISSKFLLNNGE